jgi:hypothetical protein
MTAECTGHKRMNYVKMAITVTPLQDVHVATRPDITPRLAGFTMILDCLPTHSQNHPFWQEASIHAGIKAN